MIPLTVQADYELGLWFPDGGCDPELIGLPDAFCSRFNDWVARYCEEDDAPEGFDRDAYNEEGRTLAQEIKRLIGATHTITYRYFIYPDLADDWAWVEEAI